MWVGGALLRIFRALSSVPRLSAAADGVVCSGVGGGGGGAVAGVAGRLLNRARAGLLSHLFRHPCQ